MNAYTINITGYGETFAYGDTAIEAIATARLEITSWAIRTGQPIPTLGSASARKAVYGETDCGSNHFTIDGSHQPH